MGLKVIKDLTLTCNKEEIPEIENRLTSKGYTKKGEQNFSTRVKVTSKLGHEYQSIVNIKTILPGKLRVILWRKGKKDLDNLGAGLILHAVFSALEFRPLEIEGECWECKKKTTLKDCYSSSVMLLCEKCNKKFFDGIEFNYLG